ncbi:MAG: CBS domain-containing protein, partial [Candidatus Aerophobetes bacterium]|nr:CBS domain-containing protein [Candidatus Aerophobetes bacterium]
NSEKIPLKGHFSPKFTIVSPSVPVRKAQEIMRDEETKRLLVLKEEKLVGVVTGPDLLNVFHRERKSLNPNKTRNNLTHLLEKKVPRRILHLLRRTGEIAQQMDYKVFIVGGFVRDLLLGIDNLDIDLVVEGEGIAFANELAKKTGVKLLKKHRGFGTATLTLPDDFKLDIATSRREFYPGPAVLPEVEPASLYEDLWRRDFTLNAMAIDLNSLSPGRLIDFFGGKRDIRERKVRVLHQRSFVEDPTRVFRAIRFEQRYGFTIEEKTQQLIKDVLKKKGVHQLSKER